MTGLKLKRIAKAIAAFLGSEVVTINTWVFTLAPGPITGREWGTLALAVAGPLLVGRAVYQVKNAPPDPTAPA